MAKPVDVVFKAVCSALGLMTVAGGLWFTTLGAGTYERARELKTSERAASKAARH